jgi:hypothetical protein
MNHQVEQFGKLINNGVESLTQACKLYVQTIDKDIELQAVFFETYPEIPHTAWRRFEAVGRGNLHPKLLINFNCAARRLERCSFSEQTQYVEKPFNVLLNNSDTLPVSLYNLTPGQIRQVFAKDHVRNIPEQRAYLEDLKTDDAVANALAESRRHPVKAYRVIRGRLIVMSECSFSKEDLLHIIIEMDKRK